MGLAGLGWAGVGRRRGGAGGRLGVVGSVGGGVGSSVGGVGRRRDGPIGTMATDTGGSRNVSCGDWRSR